MAEFIGGLLDLGAQKPLGNTVQTQKISSFPAQMAPPQANVIAVQFSHADLQQLLINKLYHEAAWLKDFKRGLLKNNANGSYTVEFYK